MPRYDYSCETCGRMWTATAKVEDRTLLCECGASADRIWVSFPNLIDDTVNWTIENMGKVPERFTSRTEWKRRCKELGLTNRVEHVGMPGSDKSPETTRWI